MRRRYQQCRSCIVTLGSLLAAAAVAALLLLVVADAGAAGGSHDGQLIGLPNCAPTTTS